jgi:hypothetical protein
VEVFEWRKIEKKEVTRIFGPQRKIGGGDDAHTVRNFINCTLHHIF